MPQIQGLFFKDATCYYSNTDCYGHLACTPAESQPAGPALPQKQQAVSVTNRIPRDISLTKAIFMNITHGPVCPDCALPTDTDAPCPDCASVSAREVHKTFIAKKHFDPLNIKKGDVINVARTGQILSITRKLI